MEKLEYRTLIKFLYLKRKTFTEIKAELDLVYKFKRGRTSIFDKKCSGQSKTMDVMIDYIHQIVTDDRRLTLREIISSGGCSHTIGRTTF
ncbi:hypothetical protein ACFW04_004645 [Cataglyphis niger]